MDNYDPTTLVDMSQTLRVLNAARRYEVGVPITYEEYVNQVSHHYCEPLTHSFSSHGQKRYNVVGPNQVLSRLTGQNHHLLCLQISSFLQIRPDAILKHWARAKIARSRPALGVLAQGATGSSGARADDEICDAIVKKFEMQPAVSYADIAKTAWNAGRIRLATKVGI